MYAMSKYLALQGKEDDPALEGFYRDIVTSNGAHRTTSAGRLQPVDAAFFEVFGPPLDRKARVLDGGISSGVTTAEWMDGFAARGIGLDMIATDRCLSLERVRLAPGIDGYVEPGTRHLVQIETPLGGVRTSSRRRDLLTGSVLWRKPLVWSMRGLLAGARPSARTRVTFVSPGLRDREGLSLVEHDILDGLPAPANSLDAIRLANVMQESYFDPAQMRAIARGIRDACKADGGIVVLCRNRAAAIDATLLRMRADRSFESVRTLGEGSEAARYLLEG